MTRIGQPSEKETRPAFTLMEMLAVLAIIGILAAILMPAISSAIKQSKKTRAKADVQTIVSAWKAYYNEYGKWPVTNGIFLKGDPYYSSNAVEGVCSGLLTVSEVVRLLAPGSIDVDNSSLIKTYNQKNGNFLTRGRDAMAPDLSGDALVDSWGNAYRFLFDLNGDGRVTLVLGGETQEIYDSVIAWSAGPDRAEGTVKELEDNICSWK
jgi:prepilin-type N-terminal cleavage/methylation domain-containing protein